MDYIAEFGAFDSYRLARAIKALNCSYPFIKTFTAGKSVGGKPIHCIKIGRGKAPVMYVAGIHANEYITTTLLLRFVSEICHNLNVCGTFCDIDVSLALKGKSLLFVPLLNPDGCDIVISGGKSLCPADYKRMYALCGGNFDILKANLRGVDINHNFQADWNAVKRAEEAAGITGPAAGMFGGYFPESEPETIAAVTLAKIIKPSYLMALHTQGEVIYYGYGCRENPVETQMAEVFSCLCGYSLASPEGLSLSGGLKDWFSLKFGRPAFTFECGLGQNPLPILDAPEIYEKLRETLAVSAIM